MVELGVPALSASVARTRVIDVFIDWWRNIVTFWACTKIGACSFLTTFTWQNTEYELNSALYHYLFVILFMCIRTTWISSIFSSAMVLWSYWYLVYIDQQYIHSYLTKGFNLPWQWWMRYCRWCPWLWPPWCRWGYYLNRRWIFDGGRFDHWMAL